MASGSGSAWLPVFACGWLLFGTTAQADDSPPDVERATLRVTPNHHTAAATSIIAFRDGNTVITGSEDRTVRFWDARSGALLRTLRPPSLPEGDEGRIYALALSPDEKLLAVGGYTRFFDARKGRGSAVYLFDVSSGTIVRRLLGEESSTRSHFISSIVFSADGKRIAVMRSRDRMLDVYDVASGAPIDENIEQSGMVYRDADWNAAGLLLLARPQALQIHDSTLKKLAELPNLVQLARARFSPDGKQVVAIFDDGRCELRKLQKNKFGPPIAIPSEPMSKLTEITAVSLDGDGQTLDIAAKLASGQRNVVRRIALSPKLAGRDFAIDFAPLSALTPLPNHALAFAATDGSWGVLEADGALHRYGVSRVIGAQPEALRVDQSGEEIELRLGSRPNDRLRFHVPSLELRPANSDDVRLKPPLLDAKAPHHVSGWNHSPPVYLDDAVIVPRFEDPAALAMAPSRDEFVLGTSRQLLGYRFERAQPDNCPQPAAAKDQSPAACFSRSVPAPVRALNYSGDGRFAVALLDDGTVRWYDAKDGNERLALLAQPDDGRWLLFRPDGSYAASPGGAELAGFQLNDNSERAADFFALSRFKQRFEKPVEVAATLGGTTGASIPPVLVPSLQRSQLPPLLTILEPADGAVVNTTAITVKIATRSLSDQPATALRVRIDGRPIAIAQPRGIVDLGKRDTPSAPSATSFSITIPERDCEVAIFAESSAGAGPPAMLRLRYRGAGAVAFSQPLPKASQPTGSLRVLAIGVDAYQRAELRLRYPGKDARDLAALLNRSTEKALGKQLYRSIDMRVLTGREATKAAILEALDWLQHRATAADTTILFLAGHGINETTTGEYYFLPFDADPASVLRTMLPASTLQQVLSAVPGRILLLLDTCHSGNVLGNLGRRTRGLPALSRAIAELSSVDSGIVVMAAATGEQASIEDTAWQNGAFAKAILEGLGGRADLRRTGRVTLNMLDLYVSERVRELTAGSQTPATAKPSTIADFPLLLSQP